MVKEMLYPPGKGARLQLQEVGGLQTWTLPVTPDLITAFIASCARPIKLAVFPTFLIRLDEALSNLT